MQQRQPLCRALLIRQLAASQQRASELAPCCAHQTMPCCCLVLHGTSAGEAQFCSRAQWLVTASATLGAPAAGVCAGGGSSEEYSDVEDAGSQHTEVVYVKVRHTQC